MRYSLWIASFALLVSTLAGCTHMHGICDCEYDDHCSSRSPWIRYTPALDPPVESIPVPKALPNPTKKDL